jgi:hypothetical protein
MGQAPFHGWCVNFTNHSPRLSGVFQRPVRYALQYEKDEDLNSKKPPLSTEHVTALISFVTDMAKDEKLWNSQLIVTSIAASVAVVAAIIAAASSGATTVVCGG